MDVLDQYRRRAADCERLAAEAITEDHREAILKIARTGRSLAEQRDRLDLTRKDAPTQPT